MGFCVRITRHFLGSSICTCSAISASHCRLPGRGHGAAFGRIADARVDRVPERRPSLNHLAGRRPSGLVAMLKADIANGHVPLRPGLGKLTERGISAFDILCSNGGPKPESLHLLGIDFAIRQITSSLSILAQVEPLARKLSEFLARAAGATSEPIGSVSVARAGLRLALQPTAILFRISPESAALSLACPDLPVVAP
jgi:hypothetical protein